MYVQILLAASWVALAARAERTIVDTAAVAVSGTPAASDFSHFFDSWRLNSERIEGLANDSDPHSSGQSAGRQKRKELESKLTALQRLYDDRNWEPLEHLLGRAESTARQLPAPLYNSLLTRRTFTPSLKTILIELSLMTLSIVAVNAFESAMAQPKKPQKKKKPTHHRSYSDYTEYISNEALH